MLEPSDGHGRDRIPYLLGCPHIYEKNLRVSVSCTNRKNRFKRCRLCTASGRRRRPSRRPEKLLARRLLEDLLLVFLPPPPPASSSAPTSSPSSSPSGLHGAGCRARHSPVFLRFHSPVPISLNVFHMPRISHAEEEMRQHWGEFSSHGFHSAIGAP
jgi:hypothetical protein